jgi:hypothetical protein
MIRLNIITNLIFKVIFILLFYLVWQNSSNYIFINNTLVYFYIAIAIFSIIINRLSLNYKKEDNTDKSLNIIKRFRFIILSIPIMEYIYFARTNKYITIFGIILVFGIIIFKTINSKVSTKDITKFKLLNTLSNNAFLLESINIIGFSLILNSYYSFISLILLFYITYKINK